MTKTVKNVDTDTADRPSGVPAPPTGGDFDSSTGLNIVDDYEQDYNRRPTKHTEPAFNAWDGTSITSTKTTQQWYYTKLSGGEVVTIAYQHLDTAYYHEYLRLTVRDFEGHVLSSAEGSLSTAYRDTSLSNDFDAGQSTLQLGFHGLITQRTDSTYDGSKVTASSVWSVANDTNSTKYTTTYSYDAMGRRLTSKTPAGTYTRWGYDVLDRVKTTELGTDIGSPGNMTLTEERFYDDEEDTSTNVGDGNLTRVNKYTEINGTARTTNFTYDYRRRVTQRDEPVYVQETRTYTNRNQVKISSRNDTKSGTVLMAKSENFYDALGQVYEVRTSGVSGGTESGYSNVLTWRNGRGLVVKTKSQGKVFEKTEYDGAGRVTKRSTCYDTAETAYADADDLTGDTVVEQTKYVLDATSSPELVGFYQRRHNGTGTGDLTVGTSGNGRAQYTTTWYDPLHRTTHSANYGTNAGTDLTSRPTGSPPSASDSSKILTKFNYYVKGNGTGEPTVYISEVVDPEGHKARTESNDAALATKQIDNYVDGTPGTDDDRTVQLTYDAYGHRDKIIAKASNNDQQTQNLWGTSCGVDHCTVASKDLVHQLYLPDPTTGNPSTSTADSHMNSFNALMERVYNIDPYSGAILLEHTRTNDARGRPTDDQVPTTLPTGIDSSIIRISYTYDALDRPLNVTSYNGVGAIKNEIQFEYDKYNTISKIYEEWTGAVVTGTSPKVQFAYSFPTDGTTGIRRTSTTYPDGTVVTEEYNTGIDDTLNRLSGKKQGGSWLFQESYLGLDRLVEREYGSTSPTAKWTLVGTDSANKDNYLGLDRFGRIDDLIVVRNGTNTNRYQYTYNYNSQMTLREDLVGSVGGTQEFDETFSYDGLRRLTDHQRGAYSGGTMSPLRLHECWTLNRSGGATAYYNGSSSTCSNSTAFTFNELNEIATQGGTSLTYSDQGNETQGITYSQVYDAWHRVVEVKQGSTTVSKYVYCGLNWKIKRTNASGLSDRYYYYNDDWQCVAEAHATLGSTLYWYAWGSQYIDDLVVRSDTISPGFSVQDARFNVVTRLDSTGVAVRRYCYDGYGLPHELTADWSTWTTIGADYYLFSGRQFQKSHSDYEYRNRFLDPNVGAFMQRDPIGIWGDEGNFGNGYGYVGNDPSNKQDPLGREEEVKGPVATNCVQRTQNNKAMKPEGCSGIPNNKFKDCCDDHDDCYSQCNKQKKVCDREFRLCMMRKCDNTGGWLSRIFCKITAAIYYGGVMAFGCPAYEKSQREYPFTDRKRVMTLFIGLSA